MKNAVIIHGKPTQARYENPLEPKPHEANWLPWLGKQLSSQGVSVSIPAMPVPYFPIYEAWESVFDTSRVTPETALIGHSAGSEFILRWLSENKAAKVEQVALVAPYHDYAGKYGEFSKYTLDAGIAERVGKLTIVNSLDDDAQIVKRAHELAETFPSARLVELDGFGHFRIGCNMTSEAFPELLTAMGTPEH